MHHTLECAKSRLNPESHWLVNGSFLLTESFCKNYLFSVTSLWWTFVNPFLVVHPTHILVHPRVHRAHRLKSAGLHRSCHHTLVSSQCRISLPCNLHVRTSTLCHAKQAVLEWKQFLFVCVLNRTEPCPSGNQPQRLSLYTFARSQPPLRFGICMLIAQRLLNYHGASSQNKLLKTAQNAQYNSPLLHSQNFLSCLYSNSQRDHVCKLFLKECSPVGELLQFVH